MPPGHLASGLYGVVRLVSRQVEATGVHDLVPCRHEVLHELVLRVRTGIDLRKSAQLRMRAEDQIDTRACPPIFLGFAIAALILVTGASGLPCRTHIEQV